MLLAILMLALRHPRLRLCETQPRVGSNTKALERKLIGCGQSGNWRKAVDLLEQLDSLQTPQASTRAYNNAAAACSRGGQWRRALSILDSLSAAGAWDSHSATLCITAHGKCMEWETALQVLQEMEASESPAPNEYVYGAAIGACAASGRWEEAIELLGTMRERGVTPSPRCFNLALLACDRAGEAEEALGLMDRMRAESTPNVVSYSSTISALARARPDPETPQRATQLLVRMRREGVTPNAFTFGALALAYARASAWRDALSLLQVMESDGVRPNTIILSNIVNACAEAGEARSATTLVRGMEARYGVTPDVACMNAAIKACSRGAQWQTALALLEDLGPRATVRSYCTTLAALARAGQSAKALQLLERMDAAGLPFSQPCVTAAIAACGASASWREALVLWRRVRAEPTCTVDYLFADTLVDVCARAERWRDGLAAIDELHELPPPEKSSTPLASMAPRGLYQQLNQVCVLHDSLRRTRVIGDRDAPSFEACISACERWGLGGRLIILLEGLRREAEGPDLTA